ncbi:MAG: GAF domain-containing sensor histidine kinase [Armatimonadetes bacterium]|nr:GAF domain-containing sensor histidine kinase [Armatimonadota bacterium]
MACLHRTELLDSPPEPTFDRLTGLVRRLLSVPVALVSLVTTTRQFFKSASGLPEPWASCRETPLSHSFCQYVVSSSGPLVVCDAREDELLRQNLAILDLGVVAYAGFPLRAPDGSVLGSFCAIDSRPRPWASDELTLIEEFAAVAADEIHLRLLLLKQQKAAAIRLHASEKASRAKSDFLASVSHEIRTPLTAILGFVQVLEDEGAGPLNSKQKRYVGHVHTNGKHLLRLVNDILDLSRVEAGRMELRIQEIAVGPLLYDLLRQFEPLIAERPIELTLEIDSALPVLQADPVRFRQILYNLLSNSVKFTREGRIGVRAGVIGDSLKVCVWDSGPGIGEEDRQRIFERFEQVEDPDGWEAEGTGLGLALTRELVRLHRGKLWLEDTGLDRGSCFCVTLPLTR